MDDIGVIKNRNAVITFFTIILLFTIMLSGCIEEIPEEPKVIAGPVPTSHNPSIHEDKIVFVKHFDPKGEKDRYEVWLYNIITSEEIKIPTGGEGAGEPDIYENKVVYEENYCIYLYDLSTEQTQQITDPCWGVNSLNIFENYIVWTDSRNVVANENWDIYLYDLYTDEEIQLTNNMTPQGGPDIFDNNIVWIDWSNGYRGNIILFDLITNETTQITNGRGYVSSPKIFNDKIIWQEETERHGEGESNIYLFDISTKIEKKILNSEHASHIEFHDNKIVWKDIRNSNWWGDGDIYLFDLLKNKEFAICTDKGNQFSPKIYGDKIVWEEEKKGNDGKSEYRIYLYTIGDEKITIFGLEENTFYISMVAFIIFLITIIILFLRLRKKKRTKLKQESREEIKEAVIAKTTSQKFCCPSCKNTFKVSEQKRPITVKCPHCSLSGEVK